MARKIKLIPILALAVVLTLSLTANASEVYEGNISTTTLQYARDLMSKVPLSDDYVFYRSGQYDYMLVHGDLTISGSAITGKDVKGYDISTDASNYNATYVITKDDYASFNLETNNRLVYSNLGDFPTLEERGSNHEVVQTIIICVLGLCMLIRSMFFKR